MRGLKRWLKGIVASVGARLLRITLEASDRDALFRSGYYLGDGRILTTTAWGIFMALDGNDISITPPILRHGSYEPEVMQILARILRPGMKVVDVGSNVGYFALYAALHVGAGGHVYAFEPNPRAYELLESNIDMNSWNDRVSAFNLAVSDRVGEAQLSLPLAHPGSASIRSFPNAFLSRRFDKAQKIRVATTTLDAALYEKGIENVDLIRIDAEGSEPLIFRGMQKLLEKNPNLQIVCEYNAEVLKENGMSFSDFLAQIDRMGFTAKVIYGSRFQKPEDVVVSPTTVLDLLLTKNSHV